MVVRNHLLKAILPGYSRGGCGEVNLSPIPAFSAQGVLPPFFGNDPTTDERSPYVATMAELVSQLAGTAERRTILKGLLAYRAMLYSHGYVAGLQFLNGSFMENVEQTRNSPPGDIDVCSFLVRPVKYLANPSAWATEGFPIWRDEIADFAKNKTQYKVDSYAVAVDEPWPLMIQAATYWYSVFSHQRGTFQWKGFLSVMLDPDADPSALGQLDAV